MDTLRIAVQLIGPHFEKQPARLRSVMQQIIDSMRRLTPDAITDKIPEHILKLLDS